MQFFVVKSIVRVPSLGQICFDVSGGAGGGPATDSGMSVEPFTDWDCGTLVVEHRLM